MAVEKKSEKLVIYCAYCNKKIKDPRSNKRFCGEDHKNKFFNQVRKEEGMEMGKVNRILKKNYQILKLAIKDKPNEKVKLEVLEVKGFKPKFLTHIVGEYRNCYNLSWRQIENGYVIISRPSEEMYADEKIGFTKLLKPVSKE